MTPSPALKLTEPTVNRDDAREPPDAAGIALRIGLQRRASTNFRRHFVRHVRRVLVLLIADFVAIVGADALLRAVRAAGVTWLDTTLRVPIATPRYLVALFLGLVLSGSYSTGDARRSAHRVLYGVAFATLIELWTILWAAGADFRVLELAGTAVIVLGVLVAERKLLDRLVTTFSPVRQRAARTVFAGPAAMCREAAAYPALSVRSAFRQLGFLDAQTPAAPDALGSMNDLPRVVHDLQVDTVVICGALSDVQFQYLVSVSLAAGCHILTVPRAMDLAGVQPAVIWSNGMPLMQLSAPAIRGRQYFVKRLLDIVIAGIGLLVLAPLMGMIAVAIRLDSRGPILYRQRRVGLGGREFRITKFRTMVADADAQREALQGRSLYGDGRLFKVIGDPRITRLGVILRRTSLDELPQLWNVLRGEMSLVGPRPPMASEVALYEAHHYARFDVKPGITGPWQVNGRNAITDFEEVVRLENEYIQDWTIWKDLALLLRTVPAVLLMRGAA